MLCDWVGIGVLVAFCVAFTITAIEFLAGLFDRR